MTGPGARRAAATTARSVACWLGLHDPDALADRPLGWRAWWAPVLWYAVAAWMLLSVLRFFRNPLFVFENAVIVVVLALYVGNARRIRELLADGDPGASA